MLKNTQKILIAIIFILLVGTVSAELTLEVSKSSEPPPNIGNEITIHADLENTGTNTITNIKVIMWTTDVDICSKTVSNMVAGNKTRVSCKWKITKDIECKQHSINVRADSSDGGPYKNIYLTISGKRYDISLDPNNPGIDEEIRITVKDEDGKAVNGAKILLFEVFRIPGSYEREDPVDIGDVYTENGQAVIVINESGRYKIVAQYEREYYCRSVYRERDVKNSFIINGLKSTYGLDDDFDVLITDKNNNPVDIQVNFRSISSKRENDRYLDTQNGTLKFNFKHWNFEKGEYSVYFGENPMEPSSYHAVNQEITIVAGKTTSTSTSTSTSSSKTTTKTTKPQLKIEITPEKEKIKVGDEITIYVKSDGKAIKDADVRIIVGISDVKELKTSSEGKAEYAIETADLYQIHVEKEGYSSNDESINLMEEEDKTTVVENVNEEPEKTDSESKEIEENIPEKSSETGTYNQIVTNESIIKQTTIEGFEKSNEINYKNILIVCGIVVVLLVIMILSVFIWKLVR